MYEDEYYLINRKHGTTVEAKVVIEMSLADYKKLRENKEFQKFTQKEEGIIKEEMISEKKVDDILYETYKQYYTNIPSIIQWYIGTEELIVTIDEMYKNETYYFSVTPPVLQDYVKIKGECFYSEIDDKSCSTTLIMNLHCNFMGGSIIEKLVAGRISKALDKLPDQIKRFQDMEKNN
jgi:hypothetical protein